MNRSKPRWFNLKAGVAAALALSVAAGSAQAAAVSSKQTLGPIYIPMPTASAALQSITVTAPANGNMIVTVAGSVNYYHTPASQPGFYCVTLSKTSGDPGACYPNAGSDSAIRNFIPASFATTPLYGMNEAYSFVRIWPVKVGVTYTFYVNGYETGLDAANLFQPSITVLWVPATLH